MKYRYKLMLGILIMLCISFGVGGIAIIKFSFEYSYNEQSNKCLQSFANIRNTIRIAGETSSSNYFDTIKEVIAEIDKNRGNEYLYLKMINTSDGEIIYHSDQSNRFKEYDSSEDIISTYRWKEDDGYYYQISGNITINSTDGEQQILKIYVVYNISSVYKFRGNEMNLYKKIMLFFVCVGIVISFFFAIWMTGPIEELSKVVRKISRGDIHCRAEIRSGDEIEQLSDDVNVMAEKIEEDIISLKESVEKQERFMGSFSHEMKTPITSIIGYADLLRSHDMELEEIREAADYIFHEGKRLESLSQKMLELIVLNNDNIILHDYDPRDIIYDVEKMLKFYLREKNIVLKINCQRAQVLMDKDLFKSLISNLCDNAAKSIDNKGTISITGKSMSDKYIIQIEDNGRGMTLYELEQISEPFYRVDKSRSRAQGGAGLGLAICKKIIDIHDAVMTYKSTPRKGTVVRIELKIKGAQKCGKLN